MFDVIRRSECVPTGSISTVRTSAGRALVAATLLLGVILAAAPASAQYVRVRSVEVSERHAKLLKRSRWAARCVVVNGLSMSAQPGLSLLQDKRTGAVHVVLPAMSQPPRTMYESILVPALPADTQTIAYVCVCSEENADPNDDDCGFVIDTNYSSGCRWEGDGEARCACEPRVMIWGNGEELILIYAGDPVGQVRRSCSCRRPGGGLPAMAETARRECLAGPRCWDSLNHGTESPS